MIRPIAFCAGLALAWCAQAEAADFDCRGWWQSCSEQTKQQTRPEDALKVEIDDLQERVTRVEERIMQLEGLIKALPGLPECSGEPPAHEPCIERDR